MGIEEHVRALIQGALAGLVGDGALPAEVLGASYAVDRPKRPEHGDLATNVALAAQKLAGKAPREIAALLQARLSASPDVRAAEIAGPGFLNLRLSGRPSTPSSARSSPPAARTGAPPPPRPSGCWSSS